MLFQFCLRPTDHLRAASFQHVVPWRKSFKQIKLLILVSLWFFLSLHLPNFAAFIWAYTMGFLSLFSNMQLYCPELFWIFQVCLNKNECTVEVTEENFTKGLCPGTTKKLAVEAVCTWNLSITVSMTRGFNRAALNISFSSSM